MKKFPIKIVLLSVSLPLCCASSFFMCFCGSCDYEPISANNRKNQLRIVSTSQLTTHNVMRLIERFETIRSPPPWSVICLQMHFHKTAGADSALCCFECYDFSLLASLARLNYKHPSALEHEMWDIQPVAITFNQFLSSTWRNHLIEAEQQKPLESAETAWRGKEFENFQLAAIQKKSQQKKEKLFGKTHTQLQKQWKMFWGNWGKIIH